MHRAVTVFIEDKPHLITEVCVLLASLNHINCLDTDLIVFGTPRALTKLPNDCIKIPTTSVSTQAVWKNYHYINSIACLCQPNTSLLNGYTHILRSDADTLLTPAWHQFAPTHYTCGRGGYVNDDFTKEKLVTIAQHLGLRHQGIFNTGSTHYGKTTQVLEVCKLTLEIAKYILKTEFLTDKGQWPSWYQGVISLYASDLAINHLIDSPNFSPAHLDFCSTSIENPSQHAHIHCWHTHEQFSKFTFEKGEYDHLSSHGLDLTKISDYCLAMALRSIGK